MIYRITLYHDQYESKFDILVEAENQDDAEQIVTNLSFDGLDFCNVLSSKPCVFRLPGEKVENRLPIR